MSDTFLDVWPLVSRSPTVARVICVQPATPHVSEDVDLATQSILQLANRLQDAGCGGVAARGVMAEVRRRQTLWEGQRRRGWSSHVLSGLLNLVQDWEW